ncbi:hypothetical protein [Pseudomonas mediterranea]|uniref:hypothetical protein n=1 Tax=Pseudomonas mediterranea TaxID=183795 RepID=UPI000B0209A4|nr:hypothetical protein [Pseudomonas mediterranea]MDU9027640.1 hypothetical protein [Pseudomonas mediterranea]
MKISTSAFVICFSAITVSLPALAAVSGHTSNPPNNESQRKPSALLTNAAPVFPAYVLDQNDKILGLSQKVDATNDNLKNIGSQVSALKQTFLERLYPALFGVLGVVIAGLVNYHLQVRQIKHNESERKEKFSFDVRQKIFEYRSKQNNEFYGPLLVLLTQSKEVSKQLHEQLVKFDSKRYKFEDDGSSGVVRPALFIFDDSGKRAFRLIEELPYLGRHIRDALPQVLVIIEVGDRMATLIEKSSGLANPKNSDLSSCLGIYLAHLTALKDAYKQAFQKSTRGSVRTHTAVFPRNIQDLVKADYEKINSQIEAWESEAQTPIRSKI